MFTQFRKISTLNKHESVKQNIYIYILHNKLMDFSIIYYFPWPKISLFVFYYKQWKKTYFRLNHVKPYYNMSRSAKIDTRITFFTRRDVIIWPWMVLEQRSITHFMKSTSLFGTFSWLYRPMYSYTKHNQNDFILFLKPDMKSLYHESHFSE